MKYSQVKECINDLGRRGLESLIAQFDEDILAAALECGISPDNIEEAYQGAYGSDEEFVQQLLEDTDCLPKDLPPYVHINWERTAHDVMMNYCSENGYYFRNL